MFHAITWIDGNFDRSAALLSFDSKAARAAYPAQSTQRVENITHAEMRKHERGGITRARMLWDAAKPAEFVICH